MTLLGRLPSFGLPTLLDIQDAIRSQQSTPIQSTASASSATHITPTMEKPAALKPLDINTILSATYGATEFVPLADDSPNMFLLQVTEKAPIKLVHSSQCLICLSMYGITLIPVPPRRLPHPVQAPPHRERVCNAMVVVNHTPGLTVLN